MIEKHMKENIITNITKKRAYYLKNREEILKKVSERYYRKKVEQQKQGGTDEV